MVWARVGIAALALLVVCRAKALALPRDPGLWGAFFVMGLLNNAIPFGLIAWGQTHIDSGLASILNATTPLFTVLLAHVVTQDEKLTANRMAGVLIGLAGVVVLIGPDTLAGLGAEGLGQIAVLGAAVSYACAGLYGRRLRGLPPMTAATGMLCASCLLLLPPALLFEGLPSLPGSSAVWAAVLGLALLSTALAYLLYFRILASAGATNLLLVTFLLPVSALLLGVLVLGEVLPWRALAGMALIFAGLGAIDGRPIAWLRQRRTAHKPLN